MPEKMPEIEIPSKETMIQCPQCHTQKNIEIPGYVFSQKRSGLIKIQLRTGQVCNHEFVAFVDQKGTVRGYEKIDFQLEFNAQTAAEYAAAEKLHLETLLEILGDFAVMNIFHAYMFDYPIYVILRPTDNPHIAEQLNDLLLGFFPPELNTKQLVQSLNHQSYLRLDVKESEYLVFDINGIILNSPWEEKKKFDYENGVLKKALEIVDPTLQALQVRNEIAYFQKKVEFLLSYLETVHHTDENDLMDKMSREFRTKVTEPLFDLYVLFVKRRLPDKETLLKKIRLRTVDQLKAALW
jgi:hypothetical protein